MNGWLAIAGLGPGAEELITPEVTRTLAEATDVVGYGSYVARVPERESFGKRTKFRDDPISRAWRELKLRCGFFGRQEVRQ